MLIMCEVVSNECETLPPPSQFLSPKEKKKRRWGRALAIQSQADLFKRCRLFIGMVFLDYFVLSTRWPFRLKVKVLKYPEKPFFWIFFFFSKSWKLDSWHSKRLFKKRWSLWLLVWFDDRVFIWTNHVRFSSVAFLRNGILLRRLQTLHWKLSKNSFIWPLSSLSLGCSTDVIIRVLLLKSLLVLAATLLSVIIRILKLWIPYCLCEPRIPHTMQRKECEPPRSGSKSQPYPAGHKAPFIRSSKVLS